MKFVLSKVLKLNIIIFSFIFFIGCNQVNNDKSNQIGIINKTESQKKFNGKLEAAIIGILNKVSDIKVKVPSTIKYGDHACNCPNRVNIDSLMCIKYYYSDISHTANKKTNDFLYITSRRTIKGNPSRFQYRDKNEEIVRVTLLHKHSILPKDNLIGDDISSILNKYGQGNEMAINVWRLETKNWIVSLKAPLSKVTKVTLIKKNT